MAKKRKKQKTQNMTIEYKALVLLLYGVLSLFAWGFIGVLFQNSLRVFVGQTTIVVSLISIVMSLMWLLHKKWTDFIPKKYGIVMSVLYLCVLIIVSLNAFETNHILTPTMQNVFGDLLSNQQLRQVGGGLVGAAAAQLFVFLFSRIGTYFIVVLICLTLLFIVLDKRFVDLKPMLLKPYRIIRQHILRFKSSKQQKQIAPKANGKAVLTDKTENISSDDVRINQFKPSDTVQFPPIELNTDNIVLSDVHTVDTVPTMVDGTTPQRVEERYDVSNEKMSEVSDDAEELPVSFQKALENEHYQLPPIHLLEKGEMVDQSSEYDIIKRNSRVLEETFKNFGVNVRIVAANLGPSVTKYEIQPAIGVKVSKIVNLSDDIALALAAKDIRIEAPIPGKSLIGIEVPNQNTSPVSFREIIENNIHSVSKLEVPLGRDISGNVQIADLSKMPHLLVAGATGSGKSVAINGMITSILMKAKPNEVKLLMVDPKKVELSVYNGIPHLLTPVVTNPRRAAQALQKAVMEMERRYELFAQSGSKNITSYNAYVVEHNEQNVDEEPLVKLPYIVVIVDELADLMMVASNEVEAAIIRLAQMARAAGIHMVLATQRPSVDVITGLIKANVPSRMAFAVSSSIDSRTIIDGNGAEKLLGKGDMLFVPMGENKPIRVQGAYLSEQEVERVVAFVKTQQGESYVEEMMPTGDLSVSNDMGGHEADDELLGEIIEFLADQEYISVSMLQRRFRIGFNRAARLMEDLHARGIVGAAEGTKPRKVLSQQ